MIVQADAVLAGPVLSAPTASVLGILLTVMSAIFLGLLDQRSKRKADAGGHADQLKDVTEKYERLNQLRAADQTSQIMDLRRERDEARDELRLCNQARIEDRRGD